MLQVHVVVLVEYRVAHDFESLTDLEAVIQSLLDVVPLLHAFKLLLFDSGVLLDRLPRRVIHDFD